MLTQGKTKITEEAGNGEVLVRFEIFEKDEADHDPLVEFDFQAGVLRRYVPNTKAAEAIRPTGRRR